MGVSGRSQMTWEPKPRRWRKIYKGKLFTVSCKELNAPETKEGSYQAANLWWQARRAGIDGIRPEHPHQDALDILNFRRDWSRQNDRAEEAELWSKRIEEVHEMPETAYPFAAIVSPIVAKRLDYIQRAGGTIPAHMDPLDVEFQVGDGKLWDRREKEEKIIPADKTVAGLVKAWLTNKEVEMRAGQLAPKRYDNLKYEMRSIEIAIGPMRSAESIDEATVDQVYNHYMNAIAEGNLARETAKTRWGLFRAFVKFAWSRRLIELPRNLESKSITSPPVAVPIWSDEEVKATIAASTGQLKLHLFLMINLGMYQKDIADLKDTEVDWNAGTITRRRSKTKDAKGSPTVTYRLWPQTFALLKEFRSGGELVLLTGDNRAWVRAEPKSGGKILQCDGIARNYRRLIAAYKKKNPDKPLAARPLKELRKTSASKLDEHGEYGRYAQHFLGQSPRSIADRHYITPSQARFDMALEWLGRGYGFLP
jgi:integrase